MEHGKPLMFDFSSLWYREEIRASGYLGRVFGQLGWMDNMDDWTLGDGRVSDTMGGYMSGWMDGVSEWVDGWAYVHING